MKTMITQKQKRISFAYRAKMLFALIGIAPCITFAQLTGPSTTQSAYVLPVAPGVVTKSILTANDSINGYPMVGVPDGLGVFDNGDGSFTLLSNHELLSTEGRVRSHGQKASFISKWIIRKSDLTVLSGTDLMRKVYLWNGNDYTAYDSANTSPSALFQRFCSGDLPAPTAFYNSKSKRGMQERIYMNGEEVSDGRAIAHIVTGPNAGLSYQIPWLGKLAWENAVACPYEQNKTIVAGMDDASITTANVYIYIGEKSKKGNEIAKAGLYNGKLYSIRVAGFPQERISSTVINDLPAPGTHFDLVDLGDVTNLTGAQLDSVSTARGATRFSRTEDGAWNPSNPSDFYFNTTDQLDQVNDGIGTQVGRSRLWRLHFTNINDPEAGGAIEAVLDGTEGQNMLDNMAIDHHNRIILLEDVGGNAHNGKIWLYDIAADKLTLIARHDPARFGDIGLAAIPPFTQDEETSGVIDAQAILGDGMFLFDDQAHYRTGIPLDIVEGGQYLSMYVPAFVSPAQESTDAASSKSLSENLSIRIFPNPTSGLVSIEFYTVQSGKYVIEVFDLNGQALQKREITSAVGKNSLRLDLSRFPAGNYLVKIGNNTQGVTQKIVIRK